MCTQNPLCSPLDRVLRIFRLYQTFSGNECFSPVLYDCAGCYYSLRRWIVEQCKRHHSSHTSRHFNELGGREGRNWYNCRLKTNDSVEETSERFILFYELMRVCACGLFAWPFIEMSAIYFIYRSLKMKRLCQATWLEMLAKCVRCAHTRRERKRQYYVFIEHRATIRSKQTNIYDAIKFKIRLRGSIP